jgi:hypothetical protein
MPNYSIVALCLACFLLSIEVLMLKRKARLLSRQLRSIVNRISRPTRTQQVNTQRPVSFAVKK